MRVVSLTCSNTEIVAALGRADLLVGVDDHSDFPPEVVSRLPRLGPDLEIDLDAVQALKPDLVLATLTVPGHETVVEGLEARGLPFIAPSPASIPEVYRDIRRIADLLDAREAADEVVREMVAVTGVPEAPSDLPAEELERRLEAHREAREALLDPGAPRILVQWWPKPVIAPGRTSWTHDVLLAAAARNVLEGENVISRPLSDEEVRELAPDAVVISWCGVDPDKYRPDVVLEKEGWEDVPAIRNRRVYCVPEAFMGRPGPRLLDGVAALRAIVREIRETDPT